MMDVLALGMCTCNQDLGIRKVLPLTEVLYALGIVHNLLSISMFTLYQDEVCFKGENVYVINDTVATLVGSINKNHFVIGQSSCANAHWSCDEEYES